MKPEIVNNLIDIASLYDTEEAIWWTMYNCWPSKAELSDFVTYEESWNAWVAEYTSPLPERLIYRGKGKQRIPSDSIKLASIITSLKSNPKVLIHWRIDNTGVKGKVEIRSMTIMFDSRTMPDFDPNIIEDTFKNIKLEKEVKAQVYMVIQGRHGLDLQSFDIDIPAMDIETNYGSEWKIKHELLLDNLQTKKKGIVLLHGLPGTGKSMYIRHLISHMSDKRTVIYLPNQLINHITDPGFIPLMSEYSGSLLVIEDADEAIRSRKTGGGIVDKLLNLADGILSDFLNMQIICTFNNDLSTIDDALLRKGRLILKHQFDKLSIESAQKLSDKLGFDVIIEDPMTLAEIYNQGDTLSETKETRNKIGF
jgi:hypothetical protein